MFFKPSSIHMNKRLPYVSLFFFLFITLLAGGANAQSIDDLDGKKVELHPPRSISAGKTAELTFESRHFIAAYTGVSLRGYSLDKNLKGRIRFKNGRDWSRWEDLYIVFSATDGSFMAAYRSDTVRQDTPFSLHFEVRSDEDVEIIEAGVFDNRYDEDRNNVPDLGQVPANKQLSTTQLIIPPRLIRRSEWDAEPFRGTPIPLARPDYRYITFHHTAGWPATTLEEGLVQVKSIQDFHQNGRGWSDIGYHFLVDQAGNLYQGRPFLVESVTLEEGPTLVNGAHAGGANTGNIGLSVMGCFHPSEGPHCVDVLNAATLNTIVTMFAFLSETYGISPDNIMGHRDFGSTSCPGDNNYALLPEIRDRVRTLLVTGNRPVGVGTIDAVADADGVVHLTWEIVEDYGIQSIRIERVIQNHVVQLLQQSDTSPVTLADDNITAPGTVTYRLMATSELGYEQTLASIDIDVVPPASPLLASSFPNPTTDVTTIRFFLKQDGFVQLNVYDLTGREVTTLTDTYLDGGRWYYHTLDTSVLPSGTYYNRILVEGFAGIVFDESKSVVVVR